MNDPECKAIGVVLNLGHNQSGESLDRWIYLDRVPEIGHLIWLDEVVYRAEEIAHVVQSNGASNHVECRVMHIVVRLAPVPTSSFTEFLGGMLGSRTAA